MNVRLTGYNWLSDGCVSARGYCHDSHGILHCGQDLVDYFASASDETSLRGLLSDANGIFAVVINKPDFKAIAIDGSRIYPLFYSGCSLFGPGNPRRLLYRDAAYTYR